MVGDLRKASAFLRSSKANKSRIQQTKNPGHIPGVDEKDNNNLVHVNSRVGDNSSSQARGCGLLAAGILKDQEHADSLHKDTTIAMPRRPFSESSKNQDGIIVQANSADSASRNNGDVDPSRDDSLSDSRVINPACVSDIDKPDGCVTSDAGQIQPSRATSDATVPQSSAENIRSLPASSRQTRPLPHSISYDKSTMLTLDENQELHVPSSVRAGNMPVPQMSSRVSQAMMGRRHSMDSSIGRSRPPTFVRTYREVKWKRVSKPPKTRQIPRTSSTGNLAAAAGAGPGADGEADSREYITGTHIIRQRVPIFMTSGDPPDPMGRRFSAGDLIPLTGPGQHWAPNGKCLVIRDMVPSKLAETSTSDDSGSSSSSPASSSEDVRSARSSGRRHSSGERDDSCEFSLIDEDDEDSSEDGSDEDEDGENDDNLPSKLTDTESPLGASVNSSSSPPSTDNLSAFSKKPDVQKAFDLRRLALENSLQQKAIAFHQAAVPHPETFTQATAGSPAQFFFPALLQSTASASQQPVMVPALMPPPMVMTEAHMPTAAHVLPTLTISSAPEPTSAVATQPRLFATLNLPLIPVSAQLAPLSASVHPHLVSDANLGVPMPALSVSSGVAPPFCMTSATSQNVLSLTDQPAVISSVPHPTMIPLKVSSSAVVDGNPSAIISETTRDFAASSSDLHPTIRNVLDAQQHAASQPFVSRPPSPYDMPWVLTSTKIADANVYVSSSCSPNSHMSIRSAHWISPRNVEGTIPINLDDAKAIRVETVSVPTTCGDETLQFQKVSYSSGFIISSAQWVAPTEAKESSSSSGLNTVATGAPLAQQPDLPDPDSVSRQNVPDAAGMKPSSAPKKIRRKYVPLNTGVNQQPILSLSETHTSVKSAPPFRKSKPKISVVSVKDDCLNDQETLSSVQKANAVPRKLKRNFTVEKIKIDPLQLLESDLCAQLGSPSTITPTSPGISKRRFVLDKAAHDSLGSNVAAVKDLSPTFNFVSTPLHPARGFVLKDVKESIFRNRAEKEESSSSLSPSSRESEQVLQDVVSPENDTVNVTLSKATTSVSGEDNTQSASIPTMGETESTADSMQPTNPPSELEPAAESTHLTHVVSESEPTVETTLMKNALNGSESANESTQLKDTLSGSEPAAESMQLAHAKNDTEPATDSTQVMSAFSGSEPAAESTQLSNVVSGTETAADNIQLSNARSKSASATGLEPPLNVVKKEEFVANATHTTGNGHGIVTDNSHSSATVNQQKPVVDATQCTTPLDQQEAVSVTTTTTVASSIEKAILTESELPLINTALGQERQPHDETVLPHVSEHSHVSTDTRLRSQTRHNVSETLHQIQVAGENPVTETAISATAAEIPTERSNSCQDSVLPGKAANQSKRTSVRTDVEYDELFMKENDALLQIVLMSLSDDQPLEGLDKNLSGGSTVAIDNKIEQAMDLVKRHLMYAVREEVEILKQQIGEMMERIGQLEYENSILRSEAKPETLNKLQQPRLPQPAPAVLPSQPQPASVILAPAPQHPAVPQVQPPQQQPTAVSQVGLPPSTT